MPLHTDRLAALCFSVAMAAAPGADACTRVLYETGAGTYIVGRNMDWNDLNMETDFWVFPRGMARNSGVGPDSITWTSKYGSVIISVYPTPSKSRSMTIGRRSAARTSCPGPSARPTASCAPAIT
jgi:penicillin V acylase-like amidase (Ntn superfamily)